MCVIRIPPDTETPRTRLNAPDAIKMHSPQGWTLIQYRLYEFAALAPTRSAQQPVMPDDHSKLVPLLPIPNRTVKRLRADDSADPCVKVGHRQAVIQNPLSARQQRRGLPFAQSSACHWRALREQEDLPQGLGENFFRCLSQGAGNCVIIQGFADRGEANEVRWRKSPSGWIVNNIQPISVGV